MAYCGSGSLRIASVDVLGGARDGVGGSGFLSMTGVFPGAFLCWGVVCSWDFNLFGEVSFDPGYRGGPVRRKNVFLKVNYFENNVNFWFHPRKCFKRPAQGSFSLGFDND